MEAGVNSRVGNFVAVVLETGPFARYTGSGWAGERKLPEIVTDDVPKNRGDRSGSDAVRARILRMHGRIA